MIELERLTKRYGTFTAVKEIDLSVRLGSYLVSWGPTAPERRRRCG